MLYKSLQDFLDSNTPKKKKITVPNIPEPKSSGGTVKIPANEKPFSTLFLKPIEPPKVVEEVSEPDAFYAYIKSMLSKCPHFIYLFYTKSKYFHRKQYHFRDTKRNILVVMTKEEIAEKVK